MSLRISNIGITGKTQATRTRFALDEKFIQELDSEVIETPQLVLKPYNWTIDHDEINFGKIFQDKSHPSLSRPCLNVNPYSTATIIKCKNPPIDPITQLINQVTSINLETSKVALTKLDKMLKQPETRSKLLEDGKVLSLFHGIIRQFDVLSDCTDTVGYKNIFHLCLNLCKYQEFMLILTEQIVHDLLLKLLYLLSTKELENSSDTKMFWQCVNSLIMKVLDLCAHTTVTCAILTILHDTVKNPQNSTSHFKELVMKCIWKITKDFERWGDDLCYDVVFERVHKFLEEIDLKYWNKQPCDIPIRTCKTVLYTMVKLRNDKVLESLANLKLPKDSIMVDYIFKTLKQLNNRSERNNGKHRTPHDELDDIFKLIGQHEMMDEAVQQLYKFKIKHPDVDIGPYISKKTKYFQDCIHRRLSAIEDNLKSCPVKHNGISDNSKPFVLQKSESAATSEADGFMKRLQTLKIKASLACSTSVGKYNKNNLLDQSA